jgi:arginyl-tRNA--protein-N-Asp/Glu arginylyltransferase
MPEPADALHARLQRAVLDELFAPGPPHPCAYLPGRDAANQAFSAPRLPPGAYTTLMNLNFRRSGCMLYRPVCPGCTQCQNIRIPVAEFTPNRSQRRCWSRNADLSVRLESAFPTEEKHALFREYLLARHDGQMTGSWEDFCGFLYDTPVRTRDVVMRCGRRLLGVGVIDVEPASISTVYFYYAPDVPHRSLGTFNILWSIELCRRLEIPHLYLGYYIRDARKMNYKTRFRPHELLTPEGIWVRSES